MALPKTYLTSTKNLEAILNAMQTAQAPSKFNGSFLEDLGFASSADRLLINALKTLGFLAADGSPTDRYFKYLDQGQAGRVLAEGMREAYADLFQLDRNAQTMNRNDLKGKIKTLTRGSVSEAVVGKMATTFTELAKHADWSGAALNEGREDSDVADEDRDGGEAGGTGDQGGTGARVGTGSSGDHGGLPIKGLIYNIHIQLPESRDQAVYDALFKSLRTHLTG